MEKNYMYGALFSVTTPESEKERVLEVINSFDNGFTFTLTKSKEGWVAQCDQINALIAGGLTADPTNAEIEEGIRNAIAAAFDLKEEEEVAEPEEAFAYTLAT